MGHGDFFRRLCGYKEHQNERHKEHHREHQNERHKERHKEHHKECQEQDKEPHQVLFYKWQIYHMGNDKLFRCPCHDRCNGRDVIKDKEEQDKEQGEHHDYLRLGEHFKDEKVADDLEQKQDKEQDEYHDHLRLGRHFKDEKVADDLEQEQVSEHIILDQLLHRVWREHQLGNDQL